MAAALVVVPATRAFAAPPDTFTFVGSGWGHGVGLSQWGAYAQALAGRSATQILQHYYSGAAVSAVNDAVLIRVNLVDGAERVEMRGESIGADGGSIRASADGQSMTAAEKEALTFTVTTGRVTVNRGGQPPLVAPTVKVEWSRSPTLLNVVGPGESFDDAGHRYRYGELDVGVVNGRLSVVAVMSLHGEYLRGLSEVPSTWPSEALKAQVVAARTYAYRKVRDGERAACRCHVYDTVSDQVYAGWTKEAEAGGLGARWVAAVDATSPSPTTGQVVTAGGDPIVAYYFSSSGGRTETNVDGFASSSQVSYLRSVDDRWSLTTDNPLSFWSYTRTQQQVLDAFNRDLPAERRLPDVETVDLSSRTSGGSVKTAVAIASTGARASLSGGVFRSRLELPARWIGTPVVRAAGADRYATSVAIGKLAASRNDGAVVVASGEPAHLVDGLVAAPLAKLRNAPLLLATRDGLPDPVDADVARRRPTTAYLIGGEGALGPGVEADLRARGVTTIERLAGPTRYDTGLAVAREMGPPRTLAVIASGDPGHLVDALGAGGPAAATGRPILLVSRDQVPLATRQALTEMGVTSTLVVGGPSSISDATMSQLPNPRRVAGDDRYTTAVAVAEEFAGRVPLDRVAVASGDDARLVDSLPGGAMASLTVLTPSGSLAGPTKSWLQKTPMTYTFVLGGSAAVGDAAFDELRAALYP